MTESPSDANPPAAPFLDRASRSYWLTRWLILRWLGFVYAFAFLSTALQIVPLVGEHGLMPVGKFLAAAEQARHSRDLAMFDLPSLFWFGHSDAALATWAWIGFALSIVVLLGWANVPIMLAVWAIYMSFVHIGQNWYSFGWDIQILETGLLAAFLCPLLDPRPFSRHAPPVVIIWLFRWLGFRIMLGAGLIKIRGDACWSDLTCLTFHYLTQPIPNPLSRTLHFMPVWFHKFGVLWNHFVELIVPWFSFGPRLSRHIAGLLMISFQITLILSGNLSFLNWLTIVPFLACLDDTLLSRLLPQKARAWLEGRRQNARPATPSELITIGLYTLLVVFLSVPPVANLCSGQQTMNGSFEPLHLVNTYGAFGSVGRQRYEIIFEGTSEPEITDKTGWREYEFIAKPGDPYRTPRVIAPYQPRLDWHIWFAAMSSPEQHPWTLHLVWKLLHNDPGALSLLAGNPFPDAPPRYIRARLYRYEFAQPGDPSGLYWKRTELGLWLPPMAVDTPILRRFLEAYGWVPAGAR